MRKLRRCSTDTVDALIDQGIIPSGDALAEVLPQMTSSLRAGGIQDDAFRRLYAAVDQAFCQRRSLLLLNLESQVRVEELPWISAINNFRRKSALAEVAAKVAMQEVSCAALSAFPQAIVPNKLLREFGWTRANCRADNAIG